MRKHKSAKWASFFRYRITNWNWTLRPLRHKTWISNIENQDYIEMICCFQLSTYSYIFLKLFYFSQISTKLPTIFMSPSFIWQSGTFILKYAENYNILQDKVKIEFIIFSLSLTRHIKYTYIYIYLLLFYSYILEYYTRTNITMEIPRQCLSATSDM